MPLYRSKPSTIEAVQWTGDNDRDVEEFLGSKCSWTSGGLELRAGKDGAQEWVPVPIGHWLVNQPGDKSDIWPVDADYFAVKYELADA